MKESHGRSIPTTLEELVHPRYTALVIIDVQNDFYSEGGAYQKGGKYLTKGDAIIKKLKPLIQEARKVGVLLVYVQNTILPNCMSDSAAGLRARAKTWGLDPELLPAITVEGSWGQQIVEDIKPKDEDLLVKKHRSSAFVGTDLDMLLRSNNIRTLLMTGLVTEGCVDSTIRDGLFHDYFIVIARDCVDSHNKDLHDAALKIMERRYDVVDSDQIVGVWKKT